jgi:hypothetical protein
MQITKLQNQSLLDLSIQETGSIEGLFELMDSNGLDYDYQYVPNVLVAPKNIINKQIVQYIKANKIQMATDITAE